MSVSVDLPDDLLDVLAERVLERVRPSLVPAPPQREVFNLEQAAEFLGCGVSRIHKLRSSGRLPRRREGGRAVQLRSDLLELIE